MGVKASSSVLLYSVEDDASYIEDHHYPIYPRKLSSAAFSAQRKPCGQAHIRDGHRSMSFSSASEFGEVREARSERGITRRMSSACEREEMEDPVSSFRDSLGDHED